MAALLRLAFWIFVLLLALSFFGISVQSIIGSPAGKANFGYAFYWLVQAWDWLTAFIQHLGQVFGSILSVL
jgi:hypothetical protein